MGFPTTANGVPGARGAALGRAEMGGAARGGAEMGGAEMGGEAFSWKVV